ncbi:alpha,alpha-trehalase [Pseudarcicella hirudinis]|uniref:Alpha,alpha-trehalase n=1 Tax=Pseudarcicella hirudinis TaxID=1079859 RepID=A0A1I5P3Y0_9BACT|nr:alpha,alpha-trehalase TreF [Pseudarcicella hirudinis]SFP28804.1 alpha,alpha-trehalase [Pseudarcicella hirudinis]
MNTYPQNNQDTSFDYGELFENVQLNDVFPDSKTFNDCTPKFKNEEILEKYLKEKTSSNFNLKEFVSSNFHLPRNKSVEYKSDLSKPVANHIDDLWEILTRQPDQVKGKDAGSLIPLPHSYIVPGGRFQEIYYWDSYFSMLGLQVSNRFDLIESILDNFSYLINTLGYIPNGNRTYFLGRSQPPFFSLMVQLLQDEKGDEILLQYLPFLEKEYHFWMYGAENLNEAVRENNRVVKMPNGTILNRYWDANDTPRKESYREDIELAEESDQIPAEIYRHIRAAAESGWDFSSRWFKDGRHMKTIHTTDIIPVDLNCLLLNLERALQKGYSLLNDSKAVKSFETKINQRTEAIQTYCWNQEKGFYFDYDFSINEQCAVYSLAAAFPLFFQIARPEQASDVAEILKNQFLQKGGLLTTLNYSGQQWDAPNGWAPLHWVAYAGLKSYGLDELAENIRKNWVEANINFYKKTGKLTEKYNIVEKGTEAGGGEYPNQDGFGWTNGVLLKFLNQF